MFSLQVVRAQICLDPVTQQPIPCPDQTKHKRPTRIAPTATLTPTLTPSARATNTPEPSAPSNKQNQAATTCSAWPIRISIGAAIALLGLIFLVLSNLDRGYTNTHELSHASLNSLDEYVEKGFDGGGTTHFIKRGFRELSLALIAGGGLLVAGGGLGGLGIIPCSWWPLPAGLGGLILTIVIIPSGWY